MTGGFARATTTEGPRRHLPVARACALTALACALQASGAGAGPGEPLPIARASPPDSGAAAGALPAGTAAATLERCVTAGVQAERAATFSGEMTATPASVRMAMQISIEVRLSDEEAFHAVGAPGLAWRVSDPGVRTFRYLRQFTNLSAPASYRAVVHFRWLNAKNHVVRVAVRQTAKCQEPALASGPSSPSARAHAAPAASAPSPSTA